MKLKYTFEIMEMDDEHVAVPLGDTNGEFLGVVKLNDSAKEIFELLTEDTTEDEIIETLLSRYDVSRDELTTFVKEYISSLDAEGLIA